MSEEKDDWWNSVPGPIRWLLTGALLSGIGSGAVNLDTRSKVDDRFRGSDFIREIAIRDSRIKDNRDALNTHLMHSAAYTQIIEGLRVEVSRLEREIERLKEHEAKHVAQDH